MYPAVSIARPTSQPAGNRLSRLLKKGARREVLSVIH
jgi:hypothetical protein